MPFYLYFSAIILLFYSSRFNRSVFVCFDSTTPVNYFFMMEILFDIFAALLKFSIPRLGGGANCCFLV